MFLNLDNEFKEFLSKISTLAKLQKLRLFIVGGAVRDYYLNLPVKDFDLILEGNALEFCKSLPSEISIKSVHKDFGTVKLLFNNIEYDLASTRTEKYPYSGCLPVVDKIGADIKSDCRRRDFTINSMYFEVINAENFKLFDPFGGQEDIKNKKLAVLHDKSYIDDPTRIFRGLAFKYRFGFDFSYHDKKLIKDYIEKVNYDNRSYDRIFSVFKKSLNYSFGLKLFEEITKKDYLKILTDKNLEIDLDSIKKITDLFELNNGEFAELCGYIVSQKEFSNLQNPNYKAFLGLNKTDLAYYYYKTQDKTVISYLKVKDIKLNITGNDLLELGYNQGKIIGKILDTILSYKQKQANTVFSKDDEIKLVKTLFPLN